ncbi:Glutathionylspermidine synthase [Rhodopseudomonas palustris HaA2]|uniref:Glutathionylspermidine synthase n=1 Tax=Rhodopseudomonas palustris (strain HaA2) TaxID=316058 RepID=Q2IT52_RHOP2|nr:glutathionylspermidine synthase family protein [Rhodopseudomonas palustris]ABD08608.1 Glutathionylspermidine synthase [Rhodopseudomonas palustris HaA2]
MRRIACAERDDWEATAAGCGFNFHSASGQRYWDERTYYAFTLDEIERQIEAPTAELDAMCLDLVDRAIRDEPMLRRLNIPEQYWSFIATSWRRGDPSLYGRLDLRFDGRDPAKLLEYNADTPTSLFEAAVFQWTWLEQATARQIIPKRADQFNSLHERLIAAWRRFAGGRRLHLTGTLSSAEDSGTLHYLMDVAQQGGVETVLIDIADIGWRSGGGFVDLQDRNIELAFKLYPWEWLFREAFGPRLAEAQTGWMEPPWKAILSNKGILPLLWKMHPGHPNLLPAYFEDDPEAGQLGASFVRKPLYSREGANITLVNDGAIEAAEDGPYGAEGYIRQAADPLPNFSGQHPVLGSWLVDGSPCGLSIREDDSLITGNTSRFVPHAIL